jgi:hypothetical protein
MKLKTHRGDAENSEKETLKNLCELCVLCGESLFSDLVAAVPRCVLRAFVVRNNLRKLRKLSTTVKSNTENTEVKFEFRISQSEMFPTLCPQCLSGEKGFFHGC